jgi:transketolase N-terminal domain/subunit
MAEILSVLFFDEMKYTTAEPRHPANDRFVLSKVKILNNFFVKQTKV